MPYEPIELVPVSDEVVLTHVRLGGRGVSSGLDVGLEAVVVHEPRDGRVVGMRPYPDMESAREAVG